MKKLFLFFLFLLLLIGVVSAVNWNSENLVFTPMFNTIGSTNGLDDLSPNGNDGTANNGVTFTNVSQTSFDFDGSNQFIDLGSANGVKTISAWVNPDTTITTSVPDCYFRDGGGTPYLCLGGNIAGAMSDEMVTLAVSGGFFYLTAAQTVSQFNSNTWYNIVLSEENGGYRVYINGVDYGVTNNATSPVIDRDYSNPEIGTGAGVFWNGQMTSLYLLSTSINSSDVSSIYAEGFNYNPYLANGNFSITAEDAWTGLSINNFSAFINGTTYNTSTGIITTDILSNTTSLYNIIVFDNNNYVNRTYEDYNVSTNLEASLYPYNSVNITFKYENNLSIADNENISIEFISDVYGTNFTTTNGLLNVTIPFPSDYTLRYSAPGFLERNYLFTLTDGTYNELILYLPLDNADNVTISVFDSFQYPLIGATVKTLKYFIDTNSFLQVSSQETNFEGLLVERLELGSEFYKFIVELNGDTVLSTDSTYVYGDFELVANTQESGFNPLFALTGLYGEITVNESARSVLYEFSDRDNLASQGCLEIYYYNVFNRVLVNDSCVSGASGSVTLIVSNVTGSYEARGYITKDNIEYFVTMDNFEVNSSDAFSDSDSLLLSVFIIIISFFLGFFAIEIGLVSAGFTTMILSIVGLLDLSISVTIPIFVLSLVAAFLIANKRRGGFL